MTDSVSNTDANEPTRGLPEEGEDTQGPAAEATQAGENDTQEDVLDEILAELDEEFPAPDVPEAVEDPAEEPASPGAPDDAALVSLREEFESLNDRHLRLAAEFNNYRRRVEQERADLWSRAQAEIMGRFLDVLDDLQRVAALDLSNATVEAIMEGIDLVDRKFVRMLSDAGVEVLDPKGERFNPESMEAMMRVAAENEDDDDTVDQVFQKGYALKGQLIRPARVSVRKHG